MDRGIATKPNVATLRERGYHYIVGLASQSREPWVERIREAAFEQLDPQHPQISACRLEHEGEAFLLVRSTDRREKDRAIRERFLERLEGELKTLSERVAAGKVSADEARTRIGRLRQEYQRASRFVHTELLEDSDGLRLALSRDEAALATAELLDGLYILKTDRQELDKARLWSLYMMLQDVERSFRHLKTSLGLRPIYHQQTHRCDGHVFISVLAYHLLHAVERTAQSQGDHRSWPTLASELETHRALTIEVDDVDYQRHHLRLATTPTADQKAIYRSLGLTPKPLRTRRYVVASESSHENEDPTSTTQ
jgi:transposase